MSDNTVVSFSNPAFRDELTDLVRAGAQRLIRQAVEAELKAFLVEHRDEREAGARLAVVRNGHLPGRTILAGVGEVVLAR